MISIQQQRLFLAGALAALCCWKADARGFPAWMQVEPPRPVEDAQTQFSEFQSGVLQGFANRAPAKRFAYGSETIFSGDATWRFFGNSGATAPTSAYFLSEPRHPPFLVVVQPFCNEATCTTLLETIAAIRAPKPIAQGDTPLRREWRAIVAQEPCDPLRPIAMRPPRKPVGGVRLGVDGTVMVKVFHNRCGDVREALVAETSGDERLDKMATWVVQGWRITPSSTGMAGWSIETVRFDLVPPRPGPGAPVKPMKR